MSTEILIVDDSPTQAMKLQFILEENGFAVTVARNGVEALAAARARRPGLIASDIVMPDMDGYELCRTLKSDPELNSVPVMLLTTLADSRDILRGLQARADAYLTKPYDENILLARVRWLLAQPADSFVRDGSLPLTTEFVAHDGEGMEVYLEGEHHVVTAGRRQMLNLLLSTYENAVRQNKALIEIQRELTSANDRLQNLNDQLHKQNGLIEASEANYRALLSDKTDGVFVVDSVGRLRFVNPAGEELLGKSEMELWGAPFGHAFELGQTVELELHPPIPGKDEDGLVVEMHAVVTQWEGEAASLVTLRDITARRRYERRIHEQQEALSQANEQLQEANDRLHALATQDGLTGIYNHRAAKERLATEWSRARRYDTPLSVLMLDVDKFKQYNDSFGHPAGDEVLKTVAALLRETARDTDVVARYGGEEFILLLPNTGEEAATIFAERLRVALAEREWLLRPVTASIGAATLAPGMESADDLVSLADQALYRSKENGRNQVTHASVLASLNTAVLS